MAAVKALEKDDNAGAQHTPEPLEIRRGREIYAGNIAIADFWSFGVGDAVAVANAHRTLACWNALAKLTTPGIERLTPEQVESALIDADMMRMRIGELERANERLRSVVEMAMRPERDSHDQYHDWHDRLRKTASYALATAAVSPSNARQI
jgi:hypothetical protein